MSPAVTRTRELVDRLAHAGVVGLPVRPVLATDVEDVVAFSVRAWAPVFASFEQMLGRDVFLRLYPDWPSTHAQAVRAVCLSGKASVWVAQADGRPAGFVAVLVDPEASTGEVDMIAVDPDHQRRGIGGALTELAVEYIRRSGCSLAVIATGGDPGHAPARRTYERAGFTALPLSR